MKINRLIKYWLPVIFWAALIFYLSSIPNLKTSQNPLWDEIIRSFLHGIFYFIFSLTWWRALNKLPLSNRATLTFLVVLLYSISDEIHQLLVPNRSCQIQDLLIDNLGNLLAISLIKNYFPKAPPEIKNWLKKADLIL